LSFKHQRGQTVHGHDGSSRVLASAKAKAKRAESHNQGSATTKKKSDNSLINPEIDYYGRIDLVDRTRKELGYMPLALRDQDSLIELKAQHVK